MIHSPRFYAYYIRECVLGAILSVLLKAGVVVYQNERQFESEYE